MCASSEGERPMTIAGLARVCAYGLACSLWANAALGASGSNDAQAHCAPKREADLRAQRAPCAALPSEAHVASLVAAHELTVIEMGGYGLEPMRWGDPGATRLRPNPVARGSDARSNTHSTKGCTS
jgi:hypothetical protein